MNNQRLLLSTCVIALVIHGAPAFARDRAPAGNTALQPTPPSVATVPAATTPVAAQADKGYGQQDIVITAQRRAERLQDVPVTVTAFTQKMIDNLHLNDAITTSKFVPGMISQHNAGLASANSYYLRGLGNSQSTPTFDAPVTTYVDDVYVARQNANNYAFFDTERVEVLRGPQGTLFGRNTTGGAVNVIMRKPGKDFGFKGEATAGSYRRYTIKGTVDAPLSPAVLTKLSAYYVTDRGFLKDITTGDHLNGEKNWGVRGDVRLSPVDQLTVDLSAEYTVNNSTYLGLRTVPGVNPYINTATTTPVFYETAAGLPKGDCSGNNVNTLLNTGKGLCNLSKNFAATANVAYRFGGATLNYILGYRHLDQGYIVQYDANTVNKYAAGLILVDNGVHKQWSHELKLDTPLFGDRVKLVTGLFYLKENSDDRQTSFAGGTTSFKITQDQHLLPETETAAVYAQADFKLTDQLTLTGGGRYTWERKRVNYLASTQFPGFGYTGAQVAAFGIPLQLTEKRFTPRVAINYKVNRNVMLFASATNGFKSGGWNGGTAAPQNAVAFRPERTWSFETGVKSELFDRRLRFNATGYYARTKDLQVTALTINQFTTPPTATSLPFNAGTLTAYGLEIESSLTVTRELSLFANPSFMHGKYSDVNPIPGSAFVPGLTPVRMPTFQFSGGASYDTPLPGSSGSVGASVTYRHNSPYWVAVANTAHTTTENFVDASVRYTTGDGRITLSGEVSNLTNQRTVTANFLSLFPGDPRRFTARVKFKL